MSIRTARFARLPAAGVSTLDPHSKDEPGRRDAITSNDASTAVGGQFPRRDGA